MLRRALLALAFVIFSAAPSFAVIPAEKPVPPSVTAIVDVPRVLKESTAAQSVRSQLDTQRSKFQSEISKEEEQLRSSEKELIKLREEGKKDAFAELEQKLQDRFTKVERYVQTRRKALDQAYTKSMDTVRDNLVSVVATIAKSKGITLVVVKQQVIWNDTAIDLTDEVLAALNAKLPSVSVEIISDTEE